MGIMLTTFFSHYLKTFGIYDMIEHSTVVIMFKIYNNKFPRHLLCFFQIE